MKTQRLGPPEGVPILLSPCSVICKQGSHSPASPEPQFCQLILILLACSKVPQFCQLIAVLLAERITLFCQSGPHTPVPHTSASRTAYFWPVGVSLHSYTDKYRIAVTVRKRRDIIRYLTCRLSCTSHPVSQHATATGTFPYTNKIFFIYKDTTKECGLPLDMFDS